MPLSGFGVCIKCNCGGKLLVCKGDDCPIVVHEKCIGFPASYVAGEFYCPYCVSRKAYAELKLAKEDVKLKKRGLLSFIDAEMADCSKEKEISESEKRKREAPLSETENVKNSNQQCNYSKATDSVEDQVYRRGDGLNFHRDVEDNQETANLSGSPSVQEKLRESEKGDLKSLEENDIRENNLGKTASSNENNSKFEIRLGAADGGGETSNKRSKHRKVNNPCETPSSNVGCYRRSSPLKRKSPRKTKKTNIASDVNHKIIGPVGRRKLLWTEEEEEMIKKGVQRYAFSENVNIPWRKILEFGRHVFHYSRTPSHLKDKWRTMLAKENLAK